MVRQEGKRKESIEKNNEEEAFLDQTEGFCGKKLSNCVTLPN